MYVATNSNTQGNTRVHPRCANAHNYLGPTLGGDETLKCGFKIDYTLRDFASLITVDGKISPMDESVIRGKN